MNQSLNANRNTGKILMYAALVLGAVLMIFLRLDATDQL